MLKEEDLEPIIAGVPSFQKKWLRWKAEGELFEPVFVTFTFLMTQHLIERAIGDDFTDFSLLPSA